MHKPTTNHRQTDAFNQAFSSLVCPITGAGPMRNAQLRTDSVDFGSETNAQSPGLLQRLRTMWRQRFPSANADLVAGARGV